MGPLTSFPPQLKANTTPSSAFASSFVEGRKAAAAIDIPALLRWADKLADLVGKVEDQQEQVHGAARARSVSPLPPSAPSCAEFATLEQERDLLMAEIRSLKDEVGQVSCSSAFFVCQPRPQSRRLTRSTGVIDLSCDQLSNHEVQLRQALEGVTAENTTLRSAYQDLVGEINVLYDVSQCWRASDSRLSRSLTS